MADFRLAIFCQSKPLWVSIKFKAHVCFFPLFFFLPKCPDNPTFLARYLVNKVVGWLYSTLFLGNRWIKHYITKETNCWWFIFTYNKFYVPCRAKTLYILFSINPHFDFQSVFLIFFICLWVNNSYSFLLVSILIFQLYAVFSIWWNCALLC